MTHDELIWLAGYLEGEGSFMKGPPSSPTKPIIGVQTTDLDIIERVSTLFGVSYSKSKKYQTHHKQAYGCQLRGSRAYTLMLDLYPHMGIRRQSQISVAISNATYRQRGDNARVLTESDVRDIKYNLKHKNQSISELSRKFGVNRCIIRGIRDGNRWKHVN